MSSLAYVTSSDICIGEFTVRQSLYFSARLRLGDTATETLVQQRVVEVATLVGLVDCLDTVIGSTLVSGISGGQKRRLMIATELLALPSVVLLDEPTTGKDSYHDSYIFSFIRIHLFVMI